MEQNGRLFARFRKANVRPEVFKVIQQLLQHCTRSLTEAEPYDHYRSDRIVSFLPRRLGNERALVDGPAFRSAILRNAGDRSFINGKRIILTSYPCFQSRESDLRSFAREASSRSQRRLWRCGGMDFRGAAVAQKADRLIGSDNDYLFPIELPHARSLGW